MKKIYSISIDSTTVTRQGLKNIEAFLAEISTIDGANVNKEKIEFTCDSEKEKEIIQIAERYSIVNIIGLFTNETH